MPLRINQETGELEWIDQETQDQIDALLKQISQRAAHTGVGKVVIMGTTFSTENNHDFAQLWNESNDIRYWPIIPKKRKAGPVNYFRPTWDRTLYVGQEMYDMAKANKDHPLHIFLRKPPLPPDWPPTRSTEEKMKDIFNEIYNRRKA